MESPQCSVVRAVALAVKALKWPGPKALQIPQAARMPCRTAQLALLATFDRSRPLVTPHSATSSILYGG